MLLELLLGLSIGIVILSLLFSLMGATQKSLHHSQIYHKLIFEDRNCLNYIKNEIQSADLIIIHPSSDIGVILVQEPNSVESKYKYIYYSVNEDLELMRKTYSHSRLISHIESTEGSNGVLSQVASCRGKVEGHYVNIKIQKKEGTILEQNVGIRARIYEKK
ncbi:MAG: hypothetical protein Q4P25_00615 [Tissierellia bacterium]|nr:hypothetical protein [Tissierellia bacterium]